MTPDKMLPGKVYQFLLSVNGRSTCQVARLVRETPEHYFVSPIYGLGVFKFLKSSVVFIDEHPIRARITPVMRPVQLKLDIQ